MIGVMHDIPSVVRGRGQLLDSWPIRRMSMEKQVLDTSMDTRLLAVVTQTLRGGADLCVVTNIATLVAGTTGKRGHVEFYVGKAVLQSDSVDPIVCT